MTSAALMLSEEQRALLCRLVAGTVPGARVAVFGSRATGRARPFSDVDLLVLSPDPLPDAQRLALIDALEASELPFRVDVVPVATLPPGLRGRVLAEALAL